MYIWGKYCDFWKILDYSNYRVDRSIIYVKKNFFGIKIVGLKNKDKYK